MYEILITKRKQSALTLTLILIILDMRKTTDGSSLTIILQNTNETERSTKDYKLEFFDHTHESVRTINGKFCSSDDSVI